MKFNAHNIHLLNKSNYYKFGWITGAIVGATFLLFLWHLFMAAAFYYIWNWYIVGFFEIKRMTLSVAYAISLLCSLCSFKFSYNQSHNHADVGEYVARQIGIVGIIWVLGWLGTWLL